MHFLVEEAAVFALLYPVVLFREDDQAAGHSQTLKHAPILERLVERHAEVVLADGEQDGRAEVFRKANRILFAPDFALFPYRAAIVYFAVVDDVAGAPLRLEVDKTRVTNQRFYASLLPATVC